ncbi:MAG: hypothetical protein KOO63_08230 [Bacteroidales bacterium]|nr:hypothetical protein [Candidatus Latescibacterota bacterium]
MSCIPHVMISYSDDGGETWSHEQWKPLINCHKNYLNRVILRRGGSAYNRIYRLKYSENSSFTLVSAHADVGAGI